MTNHPIYLACHEFLVAGTDGGPTTKSARWYEATTYVAVGQICQIEFTAIEEGNWTFHCYKSHQAMNAMVQDVPTMIGIDHRGLGKKITDLIPKNMVISERGMADMASFVLMLLTIGIKFSIKEL